MITQLKKATMAFTKPKLYAPLLELSNEILNITIAQGAAKLSGSEKILIFWVQE